MQLGLAVGHAGDQRRLLDDPAPAAASCGEAGQRAVARAVAGALGGPLRSRAAGASAVSAAQAVDVQAVERPRQQRLVGQEPDLLAVGRHARRAPRRRTASSRVSFCPPGHPDARHQPAQVPLPAAGVGLVEVVEVDHEVALRRGVEAEVAQVGVAADHRGDAGGRQVRHVVGHHDGGAAQEPVRRRDHPARPAPAPAARPGPRAMSMICCTGSGRPTGGVQSPSDLRGTRSAAACRARTARRGRRVACAGTRRPCRRPRRARCGRARSRAEC